MTRSDRQQWRIEPTPDPTQILVTRDFETDHETRRVFRSDDFAIKSWLFESPGMREKKVAGLIFRVCGKCNPVPTDLFTCARAFMFIPPHCCATANTFPFEPSDFTDLVQILVEGTANYKTWKAIAAIPTLVTLEVYPPHDALFMCDSAELHLPALITKPPKMRYLHIHLRDNTSLTFGKNLDWDNYQSAMEFDIYVEHTVSFKTLVALLDTFDRAFTPGKTMIFNVTIDHPAPYGLGDDEIKAYECAIGLLARLSAQKHHVVLYRAHPIRHSTRIFGAFYESMIESSADDETQRRYEKQSRRYFKHSFPRSTRDSNPTPLPIENTANPEVEEPKKGTREDTCWECQKDFSPGSTQRVYHEPDYDLGDVLGVIRMCSDCVRLYTARELEKKTQKMKQAYAHIVEHAMFGPPKSRQEPSIVTEEDLLPKARMLVHTMTQKGVTKFKNQPNGSILVTSAPSHRQAEMMQEAINKLYSS